MSPENQVVENHRILSINSGSTPSLESMIREERARAARDSGDAPRSSSIFLPVCAETLVAALASCWIGPFCSIHAGLGLPNHARNADQSQQPEATTTPALMMAPVSKTCIISTFRNTEVKCSNLVKGNFDLVPHWKRGRGEFFLNYYSSSVSCFRAQKGLIFRFWVQWEP